jgi:hypothetical protein
LRTERYDITKLGRDIQPVSSGFGAPAAIAKPDTATLKVQADRAMRDLVVIDSIQRPPDN